MNALEVLKEARKLIETPTQWTQNTLARDVNGHATDLFSGDAVCYCAVGAIETVNGGNAGYEAHIALGATVSKKLCSFAEYNDTHSHAEVLAVWDETIRRLEAAQ